MAVGLAHLAGPYGLLSLFSIDGYTIKLFDQSAGSYGVDQEFIGKLISSPSIDLEEAKATLPADAKRALQRRKAAEKTQAIIRGWKVRNK